VPLKLCYYGSNWIAHFFPLRLIEQTGKPIPFASVGFQPAGQHLSATNAKSSQSDRSPSDSRAVELIGFAEIGQLWKPGE